MWRDVSYFACAAIHVDAAAQNRKTRVELQKKYFSEILEHQKMKMWLQRSKNIIRWFLISRHVPAGVLVLFDFTTFTWCHVHFHTEISWIAHATQWHLFYFIPELPTHFRNPAIHTFLWSAHFLYKQASLRCSICSRFVDSSKVDHAFCQFWTIARRGQFVPVRGRQLTRLTHNNL